MAHGRGPDHQHRTQTGRTTPSRSTTTARAPAATNARTKRTCNTSRRALDARTCNSSILPRTPTPTSPAPEGHPMNTRQDHTQER
ncbi:hypothetical protein QJS66_22960 [Kocuria rhizophila]|nr:hypothetical protein QJS66_22960 [Kocuria rhizophila]